MEPDSSRWRVGFLASNTCFNYPCAVPSCWYLIVLSQPFVALFHVFSGGGFQVAPVITIGRASEQAVASHVRRLTTSTPYVPQASKQDDAPCTTKAGAIHCCNLRRANEILIWLLLQIGVPLCGCPFS